MATLESFYTNYSKVTFEKFKEVSFIDGSDSIFECNLYNKFKFAANSGAGTSTTIVFQNVPTQGIYSFEIELDWVNGDITFPASWSVTPSGFGHYLIKGFSSDSGVSFEIVIIPLGQGDIISSSRLGNWIVLEDQKPVNTVGGAFYSGSWRTRDLNTEVSDPNNNCALASNEFTLTAGNYGVLIATAPAARVDRHQCRLIKDGSPVQYSAVSYANSTQNMSTPAILFYYVGTLASNAVFSVEHRGETDSIAGGYGFGYDSLWGVAVFTQVAIEDLN